MSAVDDQPHGPSEPAATFYESTVKIPGMGEPPERCRDLQPVGFCDSGHTILGRSSCETRYCPDHWRDYIEEAVIGMVARMAAYRHVQDGAEKRCSHVVASPEQDRRWSVRALWDSRSDAYEALEAAGVDGGAMVTHPYRTNDRGDRLFEAAVSAGAIEEDTGRWRFLRDATDGWDELAEYVEAAPHYHTLAAAADVDGSEAPEGWVVERVRSFDRFHIRDREAYRDMVTAAYYVLTHGGVQQDRQTVTYFGDAHPAAFDPEEELTAAEWDRIQLEAEAAVRGEPQNVAAGGEVEERCPRDGCESPVHDLLYLSDYLRDSEWAQSVRGHRDGQKRWLALKGLLAFQEERTDRPPPSARSSREGFREWLVERGRVETPEPVQSGLGTFEGGAPHRAGQ